MVWFIYRTKEMIYGQGLPNEISMCFKEGLFCESLISNIQLMAPMTCFCLLAIFASFMAVIADGLYDGIYKCLSTLKLKKKWIRRWRRRLWKGLWMDTPRRRRRKTGVLTKAPAVALVSSEQSLANSNVIGEIENDKSVQPNKGGSLA